MTEENKTSLPSENIDSAKENIIASDRQALVNLNTQT
jgi:hypothetical protein